MAVFRSPAFIRGRAGAIRFALILTTAIVGLAASASVSAAQSFFETAPEAFRRKLGEFHDRAAALIKEVKEVPVVPVYCDPADRRADGRALAELRAQLGDLERDWTTFKQNIASTAELSGAGGQLMRAGIDPGVTNFWTKDDAAVLKAPRDALEAALRIYRDSKVVDCSDRSAQRAPTPPVEPPKKDPLAGLTRPKSLHQTVPPLPPPFCSYEELEAWVRRVINPLLAEN